jgi:hypothetical protein
MRCIKLLLASPLLPPQLLALSLMSVLQALLLPVHACTGVLAAGTSADLRAACYCCSGECKLNCTGNDELMCF